MRKFSVMSHSRCVLAVIKIELMKNEFSDLDNQLRYKKNLTDILD